MDDVSDPLTDAAMEDSASSIKRLQGLVEDLRYVTELEQKVTSQEIPIRIIPPADE